MQAEQLFRTLPAGQPLDIIGDVHGEIDALLSLLHHLGYRTDGSHPHNRLPVFVGDLCDRGPDSPAVLALVEQWMANGRAQTVLGNHEINLITHDPKDGSGWYFPERAERDARQYAPWRHHPEPDKTALAERLAQWPLVLLRDDIRIVHAAWLPDALDDICANLHQADTLPGLYRFFEQRMEEEAKQADWYAGYLKEQETHAAQIEQPDAELPFLPGTAQYDLHRNGSNPIRSLVSGIETAVNAPFYANGRWRFTTRLPWWQTYHGPTAVAFGHYWRRWPNLGQNRLFDEAADSPLGTSRNAYCVDYAVGARWRSRRHGGDPQAYRLAALRWPEKTLFFDNGECAALR